MVFSVWNLLANWFLNYYGPRIAQSGAGVRGIYFSTKLLEQQLFDSLLLLAYVWVEFSA